MASLEQGIYRGRDFALEKGGEFFRNKAIVATIAGTVGIGTTLAAISLWAAEHPDKVANIAKGAVSIAKSIVR